MPLFVSSCEYGLAPTRRMVVFAEFARSKRLLFASIPRHQRELFRLVESNYDLRILLE